jgi:nucleotide-binding universal stress UspA family protein
LTRRVRYGGSIITIKNVLVATDFGEASQAALEYGRHVARLTGAALHVLHVVRHVVADTIGADTVIVTSNSPARSIVAYAKDAQIDLIVLGTHGRGGVAHLFMGSVAERVVRTAPCPVLTVRQPEREPKSPEAMQATARV